MVGNQYPMWFAKMIYDGLKKAGEKDVMSLVRCAWAGSQQYGTVVWSVPVCHFLPYYETAWGSGSTYSGRIGGFTMGITPVMLEFTGNIQWIAIFFHFHILSFLI